LRSIIFCLVENTCCNPIFGSTKIFSNVILFLLLFIKIQKVKKKENSKIYIFLESTASFHQNRVHQVNTGQTMSTRVKNEFRAVSGQSRHFLPKPSSPGQYWSNHVDQDKKWVSCRFGSNLLFFCQNPVHRVYIHWKFFLCFNIIFGN
jgi:hypothetical protein